MCTIISLTNPESTKPLAKFLPENSNTVIHHALPTQASYHVTAGDPLLFLQPTTAFLTPSSKTTAKPFAMKKTALPLALTQSPPITHLTLNECTNALLKKPPIIFPMSALSCGFLPVSFRSTHSPGQTP